MPTLLRLTTVKLLASILFRESACLVGLGSPAVGRNDLFQKVSYTQRAATSSEEEYPNSEKKKIVVIGAGWGGLSAAYSLSKQDDVDVTIVEASPRVGGLVRDGFTTISGERTAEAGQHGFWNNYRNIYKLLKDLPNLDMKSALTQYAEQGQYSPKGLEAVWPVYQEQPLSLPTGLAQAAYTRFVNLSWFDRATALPLVLAFSEFDNTEESWKKYDKISFRDLCVRLGVSRKCYEEAFEPMILTGLFAPGAECSAAAALGMAYFFVLQSQNAFDVQWCRGNIGSVIFDPWVQEMKKSGVNFKTSTRVVGFNIDDSDNSISQLRCKTSRGNEFNMESDAVVFAVGGESLNRFVRYCPELSKYEEFRRFANLRGLSVLATRLFLDRSIPVPYSANACWGFDRGVGMTMFHINAIHGEDCDTCKGAPGTVLEVDYYHSSNLLTMDDDSIVDKVKSDVLKILGSDFQVVDAAIVRLPNAVNWYYPGSYDDMPDLKSSDLRNVYFVGDIVRRRETWSQEKAFITGIEVANAIGGKPVNAGIIPLPADEPHVSLGKSLLSVAKQLITFGEARQPSLVDFLW